jgi:hypothetical protein
MSSFPELDRVAVVGPCSKRWEELEGDGAKRYCETCELHVLDLSSLSRRRAETVLRERDGRLCVRYLIHPEEGRVLTKEDLPCAPTWSVRWRAVVASLLGLLAFLPGCHPPEESPAVEEEKAGDGGAPAVDIELDALQSLGELQAFGYVGD